MEFTREEYNRGIKICVENSDELLYEAKILWMLKRPRAYALYQLAIEEIGKAMLIVYHIIENKYSFENDHEFNFYYTNHNKKNEATQILDILLLYFVKRSEKDPKLEALLMTFIKDDDRNWKNKLNLYKNQSLYVSITNCHFIKPKEIITDQMIDEITLKAKTRNMLFKKFITEKRIDDFITMEQDAIDNTEFNNFIASILKTTLSGQ